jgi:bifunctional non-homologous end joining protein LigD
LHSEHQTEGKTAASSSTLPLTSRTLTPKLPTADLGVSTVAGIRISHPDRLIYPELSISKIQLARYYEEIADWIVPHLAGRPLTLVHCPAGVAAPCIYLKHAKAWVPTRSVG